MVEASSSKPMLGVPGGTGYRSRSSSIVWIDMLTKEHSQSDDDERRISVPVYNDFDDS